MSSRIIPTQKPMLLKGLLKFERTLKYQNHDNKSVSSSDSTKGYLTWSKPRECEDYVERLQTAAEDLLRENRRLRKSHDWFRDGVCALAKLDLLKDPNRWMNKWNELKAHMDTLTRTYSRTRMKDWILFWDHQVYKILEAAYCFGLESLNENLPEIKCDLVFTQRRLQLRPNLEELRTTYFKQMRRFIEIPIKFEGFSGNASVYRRMFHRNGKALIQVYKKASNLFDRLRSLRDSMKPWTALGTIVDVDNYVEKEVKTLAEYVVFERVKRENVKSYHSLI